MPGLNSQSRGTDRISSEMCCACHCVMLSSLCCSVVITLYCYCVALLLFVLSYVLIVCTVPLPPGVNPIAVDKYIERSAQHISGTLLPIFRSVRLRFLQHIVHRWCTVKHKASLSETFLILRRIQWLSITDVQIPCKVSVILTELNETWIFLGGYPESTQETIFMKILPVGAKLLQADGRTTKLIVAFRNFVNAPKNEWSSASTNPYAFTVCTAAILPFFLISAVHFVN